MTRQSKNTKNLARAKRLSAVRVAGGRTSNPPQSHGKDWVKRATNRTSADYQKRMAAFLNPKAKTAARGTAAANRILEGAGSAAA